MIFYFSGTGNSQWIAGELAKMLNDSLWDIAKTIKEKAQTITHSLQDGENILFIFPVHSWGAPEIVRLFIEKLTLENYIQQPVYAVCTCGDDWRIYRPDDKSYSNGKRMEI
ncbi:MAG: EFR1 family ferrodoxin [Tannerellaceae bacterium]|nr:EFR1 family ferrodoxin [Tannerellaceae bacterium]